MQYDLKGHQRSYKTTFMPKSFKPIRLWMKICMNANIMTTLIINYIMSLLCYWVLWFFILRPSDLTTWFTFFWSTFVLVLFIDNFMSVGMTMKVRVLVKKCWHFCFFLRFYTYNFLTERKKFISLYKSYLRKE